MLWARELVEGANQSGHKMNSTPEMLAMSQTVAPVIVQ